MLICPTASSRTHKGDPLAGAKLKGSICETRDLPASAGPLAAPTGPAAGALGHRQAESRSAAPSWPPPHLVGGLGVVTCAEDGICLSLGARLLPGVHLSI